MSESGEAVSDRWMYGLDAAACLIAAASWPWERTENRDGWAPKMLTDAVMLRQEYARAQANLAAAHSALAAALEDR